MIPPAYYRSLLDKRGVTAYHILVNALLRYNRKVKLDQYSLPEAEEVQGVVRAVHLDHPEIMFVNFWNYRIKEASPGKGIILCFHMILDRNAAESVGRTIDKKAEMIARELTPQMPEKQKYLTVAMSISASTKYKDTNSAFWDHTAAGPVICHSAVCEGIAKLFLLFCQRAELSCAVIVGTLNSFPHAWNMVEIDGHRMYIDATSLLSAPPMPDLILDMVFKDRFRMKREGYAWSSSYERKARLTPSVIPI